MEKVVLIVGASSDLGMAYIIENIDGYDKIIAHYNHMSEEFHDLLGAYGNKVLTVQADFADMDGAGCLIKKLKEEKLMPTHILHMASLPVKRERFHKVEICEYKRMMQVSLYSIIEILNFCIPAMQKQRYGRVLFILSAYTIIPAPKYVAPYAASKYALLGLMKDMAAEYISKGITINGISPQIMETKFIKELPEILVEQHKNASPLGRLIQKEDVLPMIKYLLSDEASAVTGQNISLDGGLFHL